MSLKAYLQAGSQREKGAQIDYTGGTNKDGPEGATNTPGPSRRNSEGDVD